MAHTRQRHVVEQTTWLPTPLAPLPPQKNTCLFILGEIRCRRCNRLCVPSGLIKERRVREKTRETDGRASHFKFPDVSEDSYLFPPGDSKKELLPLVLPGDGPGRATYLHYGSSRGQTVSHPPNMIVSIRAVTCR